MNLREPFIERDVAKIRAFIAGVHFATFVSADTRGELVASHLPVNFEAGEGGYGALIAHLSRENPQVELMAEARPLLVIFTSADAYVSPSWFTDRKSAPTQAHIAVHCYGIPNLINDVEKVRSIVERQVTAREKGRDNSWMTAELGKEGYERRLRAICGIEMPITRMLGSFRLLQDESDRNVKAAVRELRAEGHADLTQRIRVANKC